MINEISESFEKKGQESFETIGNIMENYNKIKIINNEINEIKNILHENLKLMSEREGYLDNLCKNSHIIDDKSLKFYEETKKVNKNDFITKHTLLLLLLLFIYYIIL